MVNKGHLPQVILWLGTLSSLLSSGMPQLEHDFFFYIINSQHNIISLWLLGCHTVHLNTTLPIICF